MSQPQFAKKLGVSFSTVAHWEIGDYAPRGLSLRALRSFAAELDRRERPAVLDVEQKERAWKRA